MDHILGEHGVLFIGWAVRIAAQVAAMLCAAHEWGVFHRDLKPSNLMVCPDGTVKVWTSAWPCSTTPSCPGSPRPVPSWVRPSTLRRQVASITVSSVPREIFLSGVVPPSCVAPLQVAMHMFTDTRSIKRSIANPDLPGWTDRDVPMLIKGIAAKNAVEHSYVTQVSSLRI
ncbi:hypothetical protein [Streptosporangium sp. NPDC002607]